MGANEKRAAAFHGSPLDAAPAAVHAKLVGQAPAVLGFLVQCATCPQRAVVDNQPAQDWVCPRCSEVVGGFGDVDVAQAEPVHVETGHDIGLTVACEMFPQHQRYEPCVNGPDSRCTRFSHGHEPCPHQDIRFGACADCGEIVGYPWGERIPAPENDDDDYPIGGVTA